MLILNRQIFFALEVPRVTLSRNLFPDRKTWAVERLAGC